MAGKGKNNNGKTRKLSKSERAEIERDARKAIVEGIFRGCHRLEKEKSNAW